MRFTIIPTLLGLSACALAQIAQSNYGDITYSLNIPDVTSSSGSGDIFLQIKAPVTYSWVALGQGEGMSGSNIFVMYASASGSNVTVSPRLGRGYMLPQHNDAAQITVLEGTGIADGMMTANFKCSNCQSWNGGNMDFSTNEASWIHAAYTGSGLNTDDVSASLRKHNAAHGAFTWNMAAGKGGSSLNPFVDGNVAPPSGGSNATPISSGSTHPFSNAVLISHGVLASLAWVILFPLGSILIRLMKGSIWVHAGVQIFAFLIFTAAVGLGIHIAIKGSYLMHHHAIIGLVVFALVAFQPIGGLLHHRMFNKTGGRTIFSHVHIWLGRILIVLGIVNGGLGLMLADNAPKGKIAYGVIAGVVGATWIASSIYGESKRQRSPVAFDKTSGDQGSDSVKA